MSPKNVSTPILPPLMKTHGEITLRAAAHVIISHITLFKARHPSQSLPRATNTQIMKMYYTDFVDVKSQTCRGHTVAHNRWGSKLIGLCWSSSKLNPTQLTNLIHMYIGWRTDLTKEFYIMTNQSEYSAGCKWWTHKSCARAG